MVDLHGQQLNHIKLFPSNVKIAKKRQCRQWLIHYFAKEAYSTYSRQQKIVNRAAFGPNDH